MLEVLPTLVSSILLLIVLPSVGYIFIDYAPKNDVKDQMKEIRESLERLNSRIDTLLLELRKNGNGFRSGS